MRLRTMPCCFVLPTLCAALLPALYGQSIKVIRFGEGKPFQMGKVTSYRIVHPDLGAKQLTLNYSASEPGYEFSQHVHDGSDDTILLLEGRADLRQGDSRRHMVAGTCAFVPAGQIHGTVTTGRGTTMISFQTPPDMVLYTGARDSAKTGVAPRGAITPGAVRYIPFGAAKGFFVHPEMGARRLAVARRLVGSREAVTTGIAKGGEQLLFAWKGAVSILLGRASYELKQKDTAFITGPAEVTLRNDSASGAEVFEVQAPPYRGW
ncbi:MAG: cupin domain-containing protein [Acidobacteria bacterium]|nr:cupin domain-containing protein [Acidobacteriota bacterium]